MAPFDPSDHPRDDSGKFSSTGSAARAAESIAATDVQKERNTLLNLRMSKVESLFEKAVLQEGFTYDVVRDMFPQEGFVVSTHKDREVVHHGKIAAEDVAAHLEKNFDFIRSTPGAHLGAWYDGKTDRWVLDVSHVEPASLESAIDLAIAHDQDGVYDLKAQKTIYTKDFLAEHPGYKPGGGRQT